eukprot:2794881-Amphidinium_carterae.1
MSMLVQCCLPDHYPRDVKSGAHTHTLGQALQALVVRRITAVDIRMLTVAGCTLRLRIAAPLYRFPTPNFKSLREASADQSSASTPSVPSMRRLRPSKNPCAPECHKSPKWSG